MVRRFIGLDVHKRVVEACAIDRRGRILWRERIGASRQDLLALARKLRKTDRVALESTTNTWAVVQLLEPFVEKVVVSNPLKTKAIAEAKVKTDKVDAHVLAQLLRCDYLPSVWVPEAATRDLRQLVGRRCALVASRTKAKNRISSALAQKLLVCPIGELFGPKGRAWMAGLELDAQTGFLIESDLKLMESLQEQINSLDAILYQRASGDPRLRLLITLPGVDVTVAQALMAAWGDMSRFEDADRAASYLGLVPSTKQSAAACYHGRITKQGNRRARWMLVQAAQHLGTHPGPLGAFFRRLARRKTHNVAAVATARKLAVIAWYMLKNGEPYRYALPTVTLSKLSRLRVRGGGEVRRPGAPKGCRSTPGVRTRTIPSLSEVYTREKLPRVSTVEDLAAGELRFLERARVKTYVLGIQKPQRLILPPKTSTRKEYEP
jgi:transposase